MKSAKKTFRRGICRFIGLAATEPHVVVSRCDDVSKAQQFKALQYKLSILNKTCVISNF